MKRLVALVAVLVCALAPRASAAAASDWHMQAAPGADVRAAQATGDLGSGVTVAVVDTWVDHAHPAFGGRVAAGVNCLQGSPAASDCTAGQKPDSCSHGTHVAGTVASDAYGVAPKASVLPLQVLTDGGQRGGQCAGSLEDIAAAVAYVTNGGHPRAAVINLSLGADVPLVGRSSDLITAVDQAAAAGVVVVFAAGNSSLPITDGYGSDGSGVPDAVLVAATGPSGRLAGYSNAGSGVTLAAPGGDTGGDIPTQGTIAACAHDGSDCILSTLPDGTTGLDEGTSMACPHVAGAAALLLARDPSLGRDGVIRAMTATTHPLAGAGAGSLDAAAALATVHAPSSTPSSPTTTAAARSAGTAAPSTAAGAGPAPGGGPGPQPTGQGAAPPRSAPSGSTSSGSSSRSSGPAAASGPPGGVSVATGAGSPQPATAPSSTSVGPGSPDTGPGSLPSTGAAPSAAGPVTRADGGGSSGPLIGAGILAALALAAVAGTAWASRARR